MKEEDVLADKADGGAQVAQGQGANIMAIQAYAAALDIIKTEQQLYQGRLAGTGGADDGNRLSGGNIYGQVADDRHILVVILKPDIFEGNLTLNFW